MNITNIGLGATAAVFITGGAIQLYSTLSLVNQTRAKTAAKAALFFSLVGAFLYTASGAITDTIPGLASQAVTIYAMYNQHGPIQTAKSLWHSLTLVASQNKELLGLVALNIGLISLSKGYAIVKRRYDRLSPQTRERLRNWMLDGVGIVAAAVVCSLVTYELWINYQFAEDLKSFHANIDYSNCYNYFRSKTLSPILSWDVCERELYEPSLTIYGFLSYLPRNLFKFSSDFINHLIALGKYNLKMIPKFPQYVKNPNEMFEDMKDFFGIRG